MTMLYTILFGGDNRGWTYLAFEGPDAGMNQAYGEYQFEKYVSEASDAVARQTGDRWAEKSTTIDAFVRLMATCGYRLVPSLALVSPAKGQIFSLICCQTEESTTEKP